MKTAFTLTRWPDRLWSAPATRENGRISRREGGYLFHGSEKAWLSDASAGACSCPDADRVDLPCPHILELLVARQQQGEALTKPLALDQKFTLQRTVGGIRLYHDSLDIIADFASSLGPPDDPLGKHALGHIEKGMYLFCSLGRWRAIPQEQARKLSGLLFRLDIESDDAGRAWVPEEQLPDILELAGRGEITAEGALSRYAGIAELEVGVRGLPKSLLAEMDEAQVFGFRWLGHLHQNQVGGILADEMGVGKTLQIIAHAIGLWEETKATKGSLIAVPSGALDHWVNECRKYAPDLDVLAWEGAQRDKLIPLVATSPLVLTTHKLLSLDADLFRKIDWNLLAIDEAQDAKNPSSELAIAAATTPARQKIPVTGTPVENSLADVHTLITIANPGLLGSHNAFKRQIASVVDSDDEEDEARGEYLLEAVHKAISPFLLHRTQEDAGLDIPEPDYDHPSLLLTGDHLLAYQLIRSLARGMASNKGGEFKALTMMRQAAADPRLVAGWSSEASPSTKTIWLAEEISRSIADGRKCLLFSTWTSHLNLIESEISARASSPIGIGRIDGSMTRRQKRWAEADFKSGATDLLSLTLKAGGRSLNLPEADEVYIAVPWWNPSIMRQAAYRAIRRGQTKIIKVRIPIVAGTAEERLMDVQRRKSAISNYILRPAGEGSAGLKMKEIMEIIGA